MNRLKRSLWIFDTGSRREESGRSPGWWAHVYPFVVLGMCFPLIGILRVPMAWPLAIIAGIDLFTTKYFVAWSVRRIRRLGMFGPTRARWWIEVAALDWTLCMSLCVFAMIHLQPGRIPVMRRKAVELAMEGAHVLFWLFLALAFIGFALGLFQGRRIRGRALEIVAFFFWSSLVLVTLVEGICFLPQNLPFFNNVALAIAVASLVLLLLAAILTVAFRNRNRVSL